MGVHTSTCLADGGGYAGNARGVGRRHTQVAWRASDGLGVQIETTVKKFGSTSIAAPIFLGTLAGNTRTLGWGFGWAWGCGCEWTGFYTAAGGQSADAHILLNT